jgi:hypothetical protein
MTDNTPNSVLLKKKAYGCTKPFITTRQIEESNALYHKYKKLIFQEPSRSCCAFSKLPAINEKLLLQTTPMFFNEHRDDQNINAFTENICNPPTAQQLLVTQYRSSRNISKSISAKKLWSTMPSCFKLSTIKPDDKVQTINKIVHACTEFNSSSKVNIKKITQIENKMKNIFSYIDNKVVSLLYKDDIEKCCIDKYAASTLNQLYWQLNIRKSRILQRKDVDLTKMLLPEELRKLKGRKVKFDPFESKVVHALGRGKHYRAASHHSSYKIFMDRVIEKAVHATG